MSTEVVLDEAHDVFRVPLSLLEESAAEEGALEDSGLARALGPAGELAAATVDLALADFVARIDVQVILPEHRSCPGWIAEHAVVIAVPVASGSPMCDVLVFPPVALPLRLAKLLTVGPRPVPAVNGALVVARSALRVLLSDPEGADVRAALALSADVPDDVVQAVDAIASSLRLHWRVEIAWEAESGAVERSLEVLDAGAGGLWLVVEMGADEDGEDGVALVPGSGTAVWGALTALLPSDDDLAGTATLTIEAEVEGDEADEDEPDR